LDDSFGGEDVRLRKGGERIGDEKRLREEVHGNAKAERHWYILLTEKNDQ
jgi:hypothetical protein